MLKLRQQAARYGSGHLLRDAVLLDLRKHVAVRILEEVHLEDVHPVRDVAAGGRIIRIGIVIDVYDSPMTQTGTGLSEAPVPANVLCQLDAVAT